MSGSAAFPPKSFLEVFSYDERTGEPYLPLPPPLGPRIRITPPRVSDPYEASEGDDVQTAVRLLNSPEIYQNLAGPPFPYKESDAISWHGACKAVCETALSQGSAQRWATATPVRIIRELMDDGTDRYLGDIFLHRSTFDEVPEPSERARLTRENQDREAGDPDIVYSVGYYLDPAHHGRGIMTAVFRTILEQFGIPHMNIQLMQVCAFSPNIGSQKVFLKNGFNFVEEHPDMYDLGKAGKGSGKVGYRVFRRDDRKKFKLPSTSASAR